LQPDWARYYGRRQRPVELPPYAWRHEVFWVEPATPVPAPRPPALEPDQHPFLGRRQHSPLSSAIVFEARLDVAAWPLLLDHHLHGVAVLPAVVMLDMALSAAVRAWSVAPPLALENVLIQSPLIIEPGVTACSLILQPDGPSRARFQVFGGVVVGPDDVT
jgi:acyl transferase domain-containing protein